MASTLVLLAAGISTRYGRLKQLEPVGPGGEALLDYSVFDARKAGFSRVVLIIRRELEDAFRRHVRGRWPGELEVAFHHQELEDLPGVGGQPPCSKEPGVSSPVTGVSGRQLAKAISRRRKPWGTAHAVLTARDLLQEGGFAVINADDFYGESAFSRAAAHLGGRPGSGTRETPVFGLLTYSLGDTLSRHGGVSRGVCRLDGREWLKEIREVVEIRRDLQGIRGRALSGEEVVLDGKEPTSTNFWLLSPEIFPLLEEGFRRFMATLPEGGSEEVPVQEEPEAGASTEPEFLLPSEMNRILAAGGARVRAVSGGELFLGITHPEDRNQVVESLATLVRKGRYPERLWGEETRGGREPGCWEGADATEGMDPCA